MILYLHRYSLHTFKKDFFIDFWRGGSSLRSPLVVPSRGYSFCGVWVSHCHGFSCGAWLQARGLQQLQLPGPRALAQEVWVHKLSFSTACGILRDQGSNQWPLHCQTDSSPLDYQGSPHYILLNFPPVLKSWLIPGDSRISIPGIIWNHQRYIASKTTARPFCRCRNNLHDNSNPESILKSAHQHSNEHDDVGPT